MVKKAKNTSYTLVFNYQFINKKTKKLGKRFAGVKSFFNNKADIYDFWNKYLFKIAKTGKSITNIKKRIVKL